MQHQVDMMEADLQKAKSSQGISHKGLHRKIKKHSNEWIEKQVMTMISNGETCFTKENVARNLQAKECQVEQVFHILNLKGILHQPVHHAYHDTQRDPWGFEGVMGWAGDLYYVRNKEENET